MSETDREQRLTDPATAEVERKMRVSKPTDPLAAAQPEAAAALERMCATAWQTTDANLLELCRRRVVTLLTEAPPEEHEGSQLTDRDRVYLAFTEQFVFSVAALSDADVEALLAHDEPVEVYRFVAALYSLEMSLRIKLASQAVLAPEEVNV